MLRRITVLAGGQLSSRNQLHETYIPQMTEQNLSPALIQFRAFAALVTDVRNALHTKCCCSVLTFGAEAMHNPLGNLNSSRRP